MRTSTLYLFKQYLNLSITRGKQKLQFKQVEQRLRCDCEKKELRKQEVIGMVVQSTA